MTTKTAKNYSDAQTVELVDAYSAAKTQDARDGVMDAFATKFSKTVSSIRMKLVREGVYVSKAKAAPKKAAARKADLVAEIATLTGSDEDVVGSLEKATMVALAIVRDALVASQTSEDEDSEGEDVGEFASDSDNGDAAESTDVE